MVLLPKGMGTTVSGRFNSRTKNMGKCGQRIVEMEWLINFTSVQFVEYGNMHNDKGGYTRYLRFMRKPCHEEGMISLIQRAICPRRGAFNLQRLAQHLASIDFGNVW